LLLAALCLSGCLPSTQSQLEEEKEPHFLAGKSQVNAMDYKGAIESFEKALEVNPSSSAAHFELGWLYDQKESDPAAAIYHYERYLKLLQNPEKADTVNTRILACKQELARTVSLGPVTQGLTRELQQLTDEKQRLSEEVEKWRALALRLQAVSNQNNAISPPPRQIPTSVMIRPGPANPPTPAIASTDRPPPPVAPADASVRIHTVKAGETLAAISRKYGVKLDALLSANPKVDPRRLRIGQPLNIPGN
jgi:LysM repeat protein